MLVGMPTHYHISCRVRSMDHGIDAQPTEQADTVVECTGTAFAALTKWLLNKDSWLHADGNAIKSLLDKMNADELRIYGWDSNADGGMKQANDWETGDIEIIEEDHTLLMNGTACCSSFEFEVTVKPYDPSKVSSEETSEDDDYDRMYDESIPQPTRYAEYLVGLARRVFQIPVEHGVDQGDYETLREIANHFDSEAVKRHDDENEF